jgi:hypothetical protein
MWQFLQASASGSKKSASSRTSVVRTFRYRHANRSRMNRTIHFPVFVFLLLLVSLFLLSDQFSRFSATRAILKSAKELDRAAVEKAASINQHAVTKCDVQPDLSQVLIEIRRRLSGVGLYPRPIEIKVSANHQSADFYVDSD